MMMEKNPALLVLLFLIVILITVSRVDGFVGINTSTSQQQQIIVPTAASKRKTITTILNSASAVISDSNNNNNNKIEKTITQNGNGDYVRLGDIATVQYACYVPGTNMPFARSSKQKMLVGDSGMIDGFELTLRNMQIGESCIVQIPSEFGYGNKGFVPYIPSNSPLEIEIQVLDSQPAALDFDSLADTADATPRTAADIAAAYEARQQAKMLNPIEELSGLDSFIEKAKNFYFYGLFEGETGERPPWFLRPSITFPIAFAIVGVAFYISYSQGAITERGAQITDELDEIILSYNIMKSTILTATLL